MLKGAFISSSFNDFSSVENRNTSKHTDDRFKGCCIIVAQFFRGIPADKPAIFL